MIVGICQFQIDLSEISSLRERKHLIQQIKQKTSAHFKIPLSEVEDSRNLEEIVFGFALVGKEENTVRNISHKMLAFIEEKEGVRIENERLEVFEF